MSVESLSRPKLTPDVSSSSPCDVSFGSVWFLNVTTSGSLSCTFASLHTASFRAGGPHALGHCFAVGFYELVHHRRYLVEREDARSMAVEHSSVMDVVPPSLQCRPDRKILDRRVRGAGRGALRRKIPHIAGTQTGVIDQDRHLDATSCGEIGNEARVLDVAVDGPGLAGDERMHDERAVLHAALERKRLASLEPATGLGVLDEVLLAPPDVLAHGHVVEFDELVVLEKVGHILGVVLARLGDEVPESAHQLEAHP